MSLDPGLFYDVLACAYRNGALQKAAALGGEAALKVMAERGWDMEDLLDRVNEMEEWKLQAMDRLLSVTGPLFRLATLDPLLRLVSRLLDSPLPRRIALETAAVVLKILVIWEAPASLAQRLDSLLAGRSA